jgi:SAM-dependent methyltransferase
MAQEGNVGTGTIQAHNQKPAAVWSSGGDAYDEISRGIADGIEHCVFRLNPRLGERILDNSTGTGWTSRIVARRGATVTGADIASDLLAAARTRAQAEGLKIEYRLGDAESLPFETGEFDAVVSTYGVMFASKQEAAAKELGRVTRRGGRIALTTWTPDSGVFEMFKIMKKYMPAPPSPPPSSPFDWGRIERLRELLGDDFDLKFEKATSFYREPSAEAAWEVFSTGYGPTRTLANSLDDERKKGFRDEFIAFHAAHATELGTCVNRDYILTIGVRK